MPALLSLVAPVVALQMQKSIAVAKEDCFLEKKWRTKMRKFADDSPYVRPSKDICEPCRERLKKCRAIDLERSSIKVLGAGSFGVVVEGQVGGLDVAVKILNHSSYERRSEELVHEVEMLLLCSNLNNVVKLVQTSNLDDKDPRESLLQDAKRGFCVLERADGDLFDVLKDREGLTYKEVRDDPMKILADVTQALQQIQTKNIVHLDLKRENFLICKGKEGGWTVKLTDFGMAARGFEEKRDDRKIWPCGTKIYMAPEMRKAYEGKKKITPRFAMDTWSYWKVVQKIYEYLGTQFEAQEQDGLKVEHAMFKELVNEKNWLDEDEDRITPKKLMKKDLKSQLAELENQKKAAQQQQIYDEQQVLDMLMRLARIHGV